MKIFKFIRNFKSFENAKYKSSKAYFWRMRNDYPTWLYFEGI